MLPKMLVLLFADSSWYKIPASKNHRKKTTHSGPVGLGFDQGTPQISCPGLKGIPGFPNHKWPQTNELTIT